MATGKYGLTIILFSRLDVLGFTNVESIAQFNMSWLTNVVNNEIIKHAPHE